MSLSPGLSISLAVGLGTGSYREPAGSAGPSVGDGILKENDLGFLVLETATITNGQAAGDYILME
jgi:hypothetical protein